MMSNNLEEPQHAADSSSAGSTVGLLTKIGFYVGFATLLILMFKVFVLQ